MIKSNLISFISDLFPSARKTPQPVRSNIYWALESSTEHTTRERNAIYSGGLLLYDFSIITAWICLIQNPRGAHQFWGRIWFIRMKPTQIKWQEDEGAGNNLRWWWIRQDRNLQLGLACTAELNYAKTNRRVDCRQPVALLARRFVPVVLRCSMVWFDGYIPTREKNTRWLLDSRNQLVSGRKFVLSCVEINYGEDFSRVNRKTNCRMVNSSSDMKLYYSFRGWCIKNLIYYFKI